MLRDDEETARAVEAILDRCGFDLVTGTSSLCEVLDQVQLAAPDVAVVDLLSAGLLGLGLVRSLRRVAPECRVIVLSTFDTLRPAALEAGALELVPSTDLRLLEACLRRLSGVAGVQVAGDASCACSEATAGSLRTKPPSS